MDLEKRSQIPELYDLKHRHDNNLHRGYDYKNNVLPDSLSRILYSNDETKGFLDRLQEMVALTIDSNVILRNWFNFTVNKYYDKHNN